MVNRDRASKVFNAMALTILALLLGLAVALGVIKQRKPFVEEEPEEQVQLQTEEPKEVEPKETEEVVPEKPSQVGEWFDLEYAGEYKVTAYCTEKRKHICGTGHGITASGQPVQAGVSVAVGDTEKFPYGTVLYIEGVGIRIVQDTGGGLKDNQIDLAVDTHENALQWGVQNEIRVFVIKVGDV